MDDSMPYRIAMSSLRGIKPATAIQWTARLGSEEAFFSASESTLTSLAGRRLSIFSRDYRNQLLENARHELDFIDRYNVKTYYHTDRGYPMRLAQCDDAPLMLYGLGECDLDAPHIISIVGTRKSTPYGAGFVNALIAELSGQLDNLIIVSGLAYGTDVSAHRACIEHDIPTVGVLAHGLNMIYPASHRDVADRMVRSGGMLLTEYTTADHVTKAGFLSRNRIIAGLADCTIVVESDLKGGSLVTASAALEYNRDVMALPGRISDRYSRGCNQLIASNAAALITCADDLLAIMNWKGRRPEGTQTALPVELSDDERAICSYLEENGDVAINTLSTALQLPIHSLMAILVELEFNGVVTALPGSRYRMA